MAGKREREREILTGREKDKQRKINKIERGERLRKDRYTDKQTDGESGTENE